MARKVACSGRLLNRSIRDRPTPILDASIVSVTFVSSATRQHGIAYSRFMNALKKANILLDRKVLSEMAIRDAAGFEQLVGIAKQQLAAVAK